MSFKAAIATISALATTILAHGTVSNFTTDGTENAGFSLTYYYQKQQSGSFPNVAAWYAEDTDNGFVSPQSYGTADINCHINAEPGALTGSVKAGGTVDFQWTTWPHGIGPVLTYVASCGDDCSTVDKTALKWIKIDESGYDTATSTWASQTLIDNGSKWTTTVPSDLPSGNYVFRHEIIALHGASSANGAQNYPQCMNIAVTGGGSGTLPAGTLGTELYTAEDPGILFNPYTTITSYTIPGPALFGSSGSGSGSGSGSATTAPVATSSKATASSAATATSTTKAAATAAAMTATAIASATPTTLATRVSTSAAASATQGSSVGGVALYAQCGGSSYTGSTTCAEGTCTFMNDYYSQCVSA
ncbi:glycosyl hydrolase family 61-domain-containing protein [Whalleya microplaca]|nr:glycosyl hydrolase family 61-domain-containing protein [Whalleya microplaca]